MTLKNRIKLLIGILEKSNINKLEVSSFWGLRKIKLFQDKGALQDKTPNATLEPIKEIDSYPQNERSVVDKDKIIEESTSEVLSREKIVPENKDFISAPLVGTVYLSPRPEEPNFVKENEIVKKGQVLCVIEAMKIFNEIESDKDGIIKKVLVSNEDPVEFGQPLFEITLSNDI